MSSSADLSLFPSTAVKLDENLSDLQPRAQLYITAGVTNLPLTFAFNTTTQADGFHELTAVAYEGSHVRTQKRVAQDFQIQNSSLSAAFTVLVGDTNSAVEATLQFSVIANTNNISKIELFSTGASLGSVLNQSNAVFSVAGTLDQAAKATAASAAPGVAAPALATTTPNVPRGNPGPMLRGPAVGPPYIPLTTTPTNVTSGSAGVVPDGGRNYAKP